MTEVNFTVIVPTHNRVSLVETLLKSLSEARSAYSGQIEILIVDSSDGINKTKIGELCSRYRVLQLHGTNNVCKKRNLGIHQAKYEHIFFTDSDCRVMPDVFTQHAQTYLESESEIGGVLGATTITGDFAPIWKTLMLDSSFTSAFSFARWLKAAPWGTCTNISFRRDVLDKVGGFDEKWPLIVYGEDVDLGLRVNQAGYLIQCNPMAIIEHNSSTIFSLGQVLRKKFQTGRADYTLGVKHPDHLVNEFPGWPGIALLTFPLLIIRSILEISILPLLGGFLGLFVGIIFQAGLTAMAKKTGWRTILRLSAVICFEAVFETGRLFESFCHKRIYRLWTKFVYADLQINGEREKRIRQIWACLLALFVIGLFV